MLFFLRFNTTDSKSLDRLLMSQIYNRPEQKDSLALLFIRLFFTLPLLVYSYSLYADIKTFSVLVSLMGPIDSKIFLIFEIIMWIIIFICTYGGSLTRSNNKNINLRFGVSLIWIDFDSQLDTIQEKSRSLKKNENLETNGSVV